MAIPITVEIDPQSLKMLNPNAGKFYAANPPPGGGGGGATIPDTTNLISGDGSGNGANSGIAAIVNQANGLVLLDSSGNLIVTTGFTSLDNGAFLTDGFGDVTMGQLSAMGGIIAGTTTTLDTGAIQTDGAGGLVVQDLQVNGPINITGTSSLDGGLITTNGSGDLSTSGLLDAGIFSSDLGDIFSNGSGGLTVGYLIAGSGINVTGASQLDNGLISTNGGGSLLATSFQYSNETPLTDDSNNLYYGNSTTLADASGSIYYSSSVGPGGVLTDGIYFNPIAYPTASAPAWQNGAMYFDQTLNKVRIGGATMWEAVATLVSPSFTGTPTAPTASVGTNTTQLATTAFVAAFLPDDTGWTANADSGDKTVAIGSTASLTTIATALNIVSSGAGTALLNIAQKVKALEAVLVANKLPNA